MAYYLSRSYYCCAIYLDRKHRQRSLTVIGNCSLWYIGNYQRKGLLEEMPNKNTVRLCTPLCRRVIRGVSERLIKKYNVRNLTEFP